MSHTRTLIWLKFRIWRHRLRSAAGISNLLAQLLMSFFVSVASLGMAVGLGLVTWVAASDAADVSLDVALETSFYLLLFLAVFVPLFVGIRGAGLQLAPLAVFPISRAALYRLSLAASAVSAHHLFWYPSLVAVITVAVATTSLSPWLSGVVSLALVVVYVVWADAVAHLLQLVIKRRTAKELLTVAGLLVVIVVSVVPGVVESTRGEGAFDSLLDIEALPRALVLMTRALPPSLAARAIADLAGGATTPNLWSVLGLMLWAVAGVAVGYRLLDRRLVEPDSPPGRSTTTLGGPPGSVPSAGVAVGRHLDRLLGTRLTAILSKELRYQMRSATGKLNLALAPILAAVVALAFTRDVGSQLLGIDSRNATLYCLMLYVCLLNGNSLINAYAWEGAGVQHYFFLPLPLRVVVLGKNIASWIFAGVLLAESLIVWVLAARMPSASVLAVAILIFACGLLTLTAAGNFVSVLWPVRRPISAVASSPSQVAMVVLLAVTVANVIVMGGLLVVVASLAGARLQPLVMAILFALVVAGYTLLLRPAVDLLRWRRETLVAALEGHDDG